MKNIKKILVAVDLSDCSHAVGHQAAQLAAQVNAELVFLHIVSPPTGLLPTTKMFPEGANDPVDLQDYLRAGAERTMPRYVDEVVNTEGVAATTKVVVGHPVDAILDVAKSLPADMIVMGSHGRSGLNRFVLGSVSERVLRRAEVPVLVIRNIHQEVCEASSCATCASGTTVEMSRSRAEMDG